MKSFLKRFGINLIVLWFVFSHNINAQFLSDAVHSILINNNYQRIEVIQKDVDKIVLKGFVNSYYDKIRIYETVVRIPGVREVSDHIIVDSPSIPDDHLENNISKGIAYISNMDEPQNINVKVNKGIVYLTGEVTYPDDKNRAHEIASLHDGVRGIVNKIEVMPLSEALFNINLKNFLTGIIRERYPDEKDVIVIVKDGEVTFEGIVSSEEVKEEITGNISEMTGVKKVNNLLQVNSSKNE